MKLASTILSVVIAVHQIGVIGILSDGSHFKYPQSFHIDTEGQRIIVADTGHGKITILGLDGEYIDSFGNQMDISPIKIIQDKGARIIVCDGNKSKILLFDRRGTFLDFFQTSPDRATGIVNPVSVAIDKLNRFFVLDSGTCQVKVFESGGEFLFSMGREGSGEGELLNPTDLTVDDDGMVYITDTGNNRIATFDKVGNPKGSFGSDVLKSPTGIALNGASLYICDTGNHKIRYFSKIGKEMGSFGEFGYSLNKLAYPTDVFIEKDGKIWVADSGNNRIMKYSKSFEQIDSFGEKGKTIRPKGLAYYNGLLYVAESAENFVNVYEIETGKFLSSIGLQGTQTSNLINPESCCISTRGDLIVADTGQSRIQVFSLSGDHLVTYGSEGSGIGQFKNPRGVACGQTGRIMVADTGNARVVVLTMGGTWDFDIRNLQTPVAVAEDPLGNIWIADEGLGEIRVYDKKGIYIRSLSEEGFGKPSALSIDTLGRVFIVDSLTGTIRIFSMTGYELSTFGSIGGPASLETPPFLLEQLGRFFEPSGVTCSEDSVFVSDTGNGRIQKIPISTFGGLPKLKVEASTITFSKIPLNSKRSQILRITNEGGGNIEGTITTDQSWITVNQSIFVGDLEVVVTADGLKAKEGQREGNITISSNGGVAKIPVIARFFSGIIKHIEMVVTSNIVIANGKKITVTPAPFKDSKYNRVYVPFRFIGEEMGADVTFDGKKIIYILEGNVLQLMLGSSQAKLGNGYIDIGSPAYMFGKVPVVPLRFVVETLGGTISSEGNKLIAEYP